jgi:hypothetical protein
LGHLHFYCQVYAATRRSPLLVFHVFLQVHFTVRIFFLSFSSRAGRSGKPSSAQRGLYTFLGVTLHVPHNDSPWRRVVSPARRLSPCKFEASNFCPHSGLPGRSSGCPPFQHWSPDNDFGLLLRGYQGFRYVSSIFFLLFY